MTLPVIKECSFPKNGVSNAYRMGCRCERCVGYNRKKQRDRYAAMSPEVKAAYLAGCKEFHNEHRDEINLRRRANACKQLYGITLAEREAFGTACMLCGREPKKLHLDHCHTTGQVRGVLCSNHNLAIGLFEDSPELLRKAADYLENPSKGKR